MAAEPRSANTSGGRVNTNIKILLGKSTWTMVIIIGCRKIGHCAYTTDIIISRQLKPYVYNENRVNDYCNSSKVLCRWQHIPRQVAPFMSPMEWTGNWTSCRNAFKWYFISEAPFRSLHTEMYGSLSVYLYTSSLMSLKRYSPPYGSQYLTRFNWALCKISRLHCPNGTHQSNSHCW